MFINDLFFKLREIIASSPAKRDRLIFISLIVAGVINAITWLIIPIYFWRFREFVVLQYNIYFGISSYGSWLTLFLMPFSGLLIGAINSALSFWLYLRQRTLSYFLIVSAVAYQLIILVALLLIIYMNS